MSVTPTYLRGLTRAAVHPHRTMTAHVMAAAAGAGYYVEDWSYGDILGDGRGELLRRHMVWVPTRAAAMLMAETSGRVPVMRGRALVEA